MTFPASYLSIKKDLGEEVVLLDDIFNLFRQNFYISKSG